mmetsp:Transcript_17297/g.35927  ORF Transcript_17297/g.35927 Transcript_17297/m.35927 type:complete len:272 (-) Transcript_17297:1130-1945(-)|eukprot:CAMPEP_0184687828 /NCGR_PEP_ID=MMETSP0312-20130426/27677_1 /TAXON_ID=31354 /ORGANISM="Compsopogon coeruleus, Strain SAG 36.94" /LENGTH=271 /DNA_ID=CAMNT_0027144355 /DNA_START=712 /DNA_END=1527 /DNA_ORIENTATION=-
MEVPRVKIVVAYAMKGGLGDVGKFAVIRAMMEKEKRTSSQNVEVHVLAMCDEVVEGFSGQNEKGDRAGEGLLEVEDVEKDRARLVQALSKVSALVRVDVRAGDKAREVVEHVVDGASAVVACLGNRQGPLGEGMGLWVADGVDMVRKAMEKMHVKRLVVLSSMGIGEDELPFGPIKVLWWFLLRTILRKVHRDLQEMEKLVQGSDLDYLIVRPVGLTPTVHYRSAYHILPSEEGGVPHIEVSKEDVGEFMIREALEPQRHRTAVTICHLKE